MVSRKRVTRIPFIKGIDIEIYHYKSRLNSLALVDILFLPVDKDTAKALLGAVHYQALKERVDLTSLIINPSSSMLKYLMRFGFIKTSESFTVVVNEPRNKEHEFNKKNFHNWHITWFDHDYV